MDFPVTGSLHAIAKLFAVHGCSVHGSPADLVTWLGNLMVNSDIVMIMFSEVPSPFQDSTTMSLMVSQSGFFYRKAKWEELFLVSSVLEVKVLFILCINSNNCIVLSCIVLIR